MAIKVNGTTVIDDSRNLSNVGGLKTVNGNSLVGSGNISAGASTSWGAVGTYTMAGIQGGSGTVYTGGQTFSGSSLKLNTSGVSPFGDGSAQAYYSSSHWSSNTLSGTWRLMNNSTRPTTYSSDAYANFFVRIS